VLGSEDFARLRFGIGNDYPKGRQSEYVLGPWSEEERGALAERMEVAGKAIVQFGLLGLAYTMNHFNNR
jgi:PTH1 family peptidyl-tRNA hydrolase